MVVAVKTEVIVDILIGADDDDTVEKQYNNTLSFGIDFACHTGMVIKIVTHIKKLKACA